MIQSLSNRYAKWTALLILLVFSSETVLAGREHLLTTSRKEKVVTDIWRQPTRTISVPEVTKPEVQQVVAPVAPIVATQPALETPENTNAILPAIQEGTPATDKSEIPAAVNDIGGPGQPEMSAFKAVGADNMVDLFSGDFSYNIPLGDVGGYPINIFYNSGISMDQEASWVGLGWNINPGTIMRNMRGVPDDFDGTDRVIKEMNIKPNVTVGVNISSQKELVGFPAKKTASGTGVSIGSSTSVGLFYNNYRGIGFDIGTHLVLDLKSKNSDSKTETESKTAKNTTPATTLTPTFTMGFNVNSQTGIGVNPGLGIKIDEYDSKLNHYGTTTSLSASYNSRIGLQSINLSAETRKSELVWKMVIIPGGIIALPKWQSGGVPFSSASSLTFGVASVTPSIRMPLTHRNFNLGVAFGAEKKYGIFKGVGIRGYYTESSLREEDKTQIRKAYGYLYYQDANESQDALLDFNRTNDGVYTKSNPVIAIPHYTYDVFSISGQGTGGGFRAYRGDIGSIHDPYVRTRENAASVDLEFGAREIAELGVNLNYVHTPTTAGEWRTGNLARNELQFSKSNGLHSAVYFKNPGESARIDPAFLTALGNEDRVRIKLVDPGTRIPYAAPVWEKFADGSISSTDLSFSGNKTIKQQRDRYTQVISFLTAEEASYAGLDRKIRYYPQNVFPSGGCKNAGSIELERVDRSTDPLNSSAIQVHKTNHLSEITVTQTNGGRYVYGIPVYNLTESEVTFNIGPKSNGSGAVTPNAASQTVNYSTEDLNTNDRGRDHYFQREKIDPYAHSFLLTGVLSPDYVDVSGDGISDDDMGTAVKFNYTKITHPQEASGRGFGWRAPFTAQSGLAAYNQGLKTDNSDDKAYYTYGERELWYLNSIESKTMIATFTLEDRNDGKAAAGETGGVSSSLGMKRLKRIDIYSKAEWVKTSGVKRPVKTIHFEYYQGSSELCQGTPNNPTGGGKLTLKSIYFTYNGNDRLFKNKYYFKYHSNPAYDRMASDRWGNYKPSSANQSSATGVDFSALGNTDFPFADQDKTTADANAAAWTLNEITLPSGAKIKVDFEADDYAYVQNRRATQLVRLAGFGSSSGSVPDDNLYSFYEKDHLYLFIDVPSPVANNAEIKAKYLDGINQLYMKIWVKMPSDQYGSGYEPVSVYADINGDAGDSYGLVNSNRIWIKVRRDRGGYSPMFYNSMQFLIQNLASKAYYGSDVRGSGPLGYLKALAGMFFQLVTTAQGYYKTMRILGTCKKVDLTRSFIRLNNPYLRKLGGGLRVKKVTIKDSWKQMTSTNPAGDNGMPESEYGQEYDYITTELVNGQETVISSGVASYEPSVGAEENPFREILRYDDHQPLGPNQRGAVELPLGEVYFPSPGVGYSKVTVRSIHRDNVKSGIGKSVSEFYTYREFPTRSDFTMLDGNSHVRFKSNPILRLLKLDVREQITLSQGFRVQTNDMNGKVRLQASYDEAGKLVSSTENIYKIERSGEKEYRFNNIVPMLTKPGEPVVNAVMGKEIEVMTDFREHTSRAVTFNLNFNLNVNEIGGFPVPIPSIIPPVHFAETGYKSAAVLKVVNTYGILEKVKQVDKGSEVSARNLAYDAETGAVLLTETNNEFNKPVYAFNYPAYWAYSGMRGAWMNIGAVYEHLRFQNGKLTTPGFDMSVFESGDEIYVYDRSLRGAMNEPGCYPSGPVQYIDKPLDPDDSRLYNHKIWALDMAKDPANATHSFLFIDKLGESYSGGDVTIKIIRSGKRNLLDASAGGFTSLENPLRPDPSNPSQLKLFADDETRIVNTSAATFKENWRVDQSFYAKIEKQLVVRRATINEKDIPLIATAAFAEHNNLPGDYKEYFPNPDHVVAAQFDAKGRRKLLQFSQPDYRHVSWMLFDFSIAPGLNGNSTILSGQMNLPSHKTYHEMYVGGSAVGSWHVSQSPHYSQWNHPNDFLLMRMRSGWPAVNDAAGWESLYQTDLPGGDGNAVLVPGTEPPYSDADFSTDVTGVVREMIRDKFDPSKNFATGFKLKLFRDNVRPSIVSRVCFSNTLLSHPTLMLRYYNCDPSNPLEYQGPLSGGPPDPPESANYRFCRTIEELPVCYSSYDGNIRRRINPYTQGVLGNWRAELAYVYYDGRRESSAAAPTEELSKGGVIATNYIPFWINSAEGLTKNPAATASSPSQPARWKWASQTTQFNNKGFELENTDPLGRFNCGIYGYEKSLPVAVVNNSKLRNAAFDGFEDYAFKSNNCAEACSPKRHLVIENVIPAISGETSHSGHKSLKVISGQSLSIKSPVISKTDDEKSYGLQISTVSTTMSGTWVNGSGTGIYGKYFEPTANTSFTPSNIESLLNAESPTPIVRTDAGINMRHWRQNPGFSYNTPPPPIGDRFYVKWLGYVQAPEAGAYTFSFSSDDGMKAWILIDGNYVQTTTNSFFTNHGIQTQQFTTGNWALGSLHFIQVYYFDAGGTAEAYLSWRTPSGIEEIVPKAYLYRSEAEAAGTVETGIRTCVKPDIIQVKDNALTDLFSPLQGQKMVFSGWVKEGLTDCHCGNYTGNKVEIFYNNTATVTTTLLPAGPVIEGWQRYEGVFTIPIDATNLELKMSSTGNKDVYWDDLRLHPFNSNMKSFVYDPVTLRLLAEQDENNYTSYYEYDDDGTVIRVKKETERGVKTITESRSSLQKKITQ